MYRQRAELAGVPPIASQGYAVTVPKNQRRGRLRAGGRLAVVPLLVLGGLFLRSLAADARPADAILAQLQEIPASTLADAVDEVVGKRGFMNYDMRPIANTPRMAGRAKTVLYGPLAENTPARALGPRYAVQIIDESGPGDILVAATHDLNVTALGGLMAATAKVRGMSGVVVDGAVRDVDQIEGVGLAVFARSISPSTLVGRATSLARDIPVVCGGVTVYPGDYIVGDRDGVVCIPAGQIQAVIRRSQEMEALEKEMMPMIREVKSLQKVIDKFKRI
jgi:regulator of RNase E activity RraA